MKSFLQTGVQVIGGLIISFVLLLVVVQFGTDYWLTYDLWSEFNANAVRHAASGEDVLKNITVQRDARIAQYGICRSGGWWVNHPDLRDYSEEELATVDDTPYALSYAIYYPCFIEYFQGQDPAVQGRKDLSVP